MIKFEEMMAIIMTLIFALGFLQTRRHIKMIKNRQEQIKLGVQFYMMLTTVAGAFVIYYLSNLR